MASLFFDKQNAPKWLLTVSLLVNLFCFSGYTYDFTPQQTQQTQTEVVESKKGGEESVEKAVE